MRTYLKKNPSQEGAGRVAQGEGLEFKPQYYKKYTHTKPGKVS
jgi:hypothetical protein